MELNVTRDVVRKNPKEYDCIGDGKNYIMVTTLFMFGYMDRICYLDDSGDEVELNCDDFKYVREYKEVPGSGRKIHINLYYRSDEPMTFVLYFALPQDNREYYGLPED